MKSKLLNIRLKLDQYEKLQIFSARHGMTPGGVVKRLTSLLIGDDIKEAGDFVGLLQERLIKKSEEFDIFSELVADTTSRITSTVQGQSQLFKANEKRKKNKKKPANA